VLHALALAASLALSSNDAPSRDPALLDLRDLFVTDDGRSRLSPRTAALAGERVRVQGYMVHMEDPPDGAFYLAARPIDQDESGAGTGDIPASSVRVRVREAEGAQVPWTPRPIEVVGTLEVGREEDDEGRVSFVRVVLEDPSPAAKRQVAAPR
jgi:hypothetical protein